LEEFTSYPESSLKDPVAQFHLELGPVITYALNNFREGNSLQFNKPKMPNQLKARQSNINDKLFSRFQAERGITNPYADCAKMKESRLKND
jgi:hypothetical protein